MSPVSHFALVAADLYYFTRAFRLLACLVFFVGASAVNWANPITVEYPPPDFWFGWACFLFVVVMLWLASVEARFLLQFESVRKLVCSDPPSPPRKFKPGSLIEPLMEEEEA